MEQATNNPKAEAKKHWEAIYAQKNPDQMSWTQETPRLSLQIIQGFNVPKTSQIIDVGGGRSALTHILFQEGYQHLTVLDISEQALQKSKEVFGADATKIEWQAVNILDFEPTKKYTIWHDRAVFHFLTSEADIQCYVAILEQSIETGGYLVLATFAPDGPEKCSGLPVTRYSAEAMTLLLEASFQPVSFENELHETPFGTKQSFQYGVFRRK